MRKPLKCSWRRFNRMFIGGVLVAIGFSLTSSPALGQSPSFKDTGWGFCELHRISYHAAVCPRCAAAGSLGGRGSSGASSQDQLALALAGQLGNMIGQMLRGDPEQAARQKAEEEARVLEQKRIDAENERKRQAAFARLGSELKLDDFDGDKGGVLLLKGMDVDSGTGPALQLAGSGNALGLKLSDDDLMPQGTQAAPNTGAPDALAPNTDPMVVDARNVLSGLPKSVEEAIPRTPSGNRIRKGFLAIADHDWNTALLWFKDAYNREPGDPELQRLVELAQFTLDSQAAARSHAAESHAANAQAAPPSDGTASDAPAQAGAGLEAPDIAPYTAGDFKSGKVAAVVETRESSHARMVAQRMASEARVAAVYDELRKQYGPNVPSSRYYSSETNLKKEKARSGEGLSKEELNAQFEAALTLYLTKHPIHYLAPAGGSAVADEIILGGKG